MRVERGQKNEQCTSEGEEGTEARKYNAVLQLVRWAGAAKPSKAQIECRDLP